MKLLSEIQRNVLPFLIHRNYALMKVALLCQGLKNQTGKHHEAKQAVLLNL